MSRDAPRSANFGGLIFALSDKGLNAMELEERLIRIESLLSELVKSQTIKEWYSVEECARTTGRSEFTCREWCRKGRIHAVKKQSGRGAFTAWAISHEKLKRYPKDGLLPSN